MPRGRTKICVDAVRGGARPPGSVEKGLLAHASQSDSSPAEIWKRRHWHFNIYKRAPAAHM